MGDLLADLRRYVEHLIGEYDLNECEAGDLSDLMEVLLFVRGLSEDDLRIHLEIRAEVLALVGSEMQGMYDLLEEEGRQHRLDGRTGRGV